jgi:hypothetical protein
MTTLAIIIVATLALWTFGVLYILCNLSIDIFRIDQGDAVDD